VSVWVWVNPIVRRDEEVLDDDSSVSVVHLHEVI
jgi:hypothetical protein